MKYLIILAVIAVTGCSTMPTSSEATATCRGYGFKKNTNAMAECRQEILQVCTTSKGWGNSVRTTCK